MKLKKKRNILVGQPADDFYIVHSELTPSRTGFQFKNDLIQSIHNLGQLLLD